MSVSLRGFLIFHGANVKHPNQRDDDDLCLADELAGQLAHDFGSLIHELMWQLEIMRSQVTRQPNWDVIKEQGERLIRQLREWDQYRASADPPVSIELNRLIKGIVRKLRRKGRTKLKTRFTSESTTLTTVPREADLLCQLLIRQGFAVPG